MNCYELIKNKSLDFSSLMLDYYYLLDIDEIDVIILIKLEQASQKGLINLEQIVETTHLDLNTFTQKLNTLVDKGYIGMSLNDNLEELYNFDECYKRLAMAMENESSSAKEESLEYEILGMTRQLEHSIGHTLSVLDKEIIKRWYKDYHYSTQDIEKAMKVALGQKALNVKYIDSVLARKATSYKDTENQHACQHADRHEVHPEIKDMIKHVVKK